MNLVAGEGTLHITSMNRFNMLVLINLVVEQLFNPFKLEMNEYQPNENTQRLFIQRLL